MFRQKVNLSELYRDTVGSVPTFPRYFGPETRMLLKTPIAPFRAGTPKPTKRPKFKT